MDPNPPRRARGRARGGHPPPNQIGQPRGPPPNQIGQPRGPPPNQSGQPHGARPVQAPPSRPQARNMPSQSGPQSVEQVTSGLGNLKTEDALIPIGRGAVRGRQPIENIYYRIERPESSTSSDGKIGKGGQDIQLTSNYFPITTYTDWSLYQYRVDFNPIQDKINVQRGLLSSHKELLGAYIFDGSMLFSSKKYIPNTLELTSKRNFDDEIVIITVKFIQIIEKGDHSSIQIFNLLIRKALMNLNLSLVGRNYYDEKAKINIPKHRLQLWPGYETTIGMYDSGLLLRSEISTKIMREETVLDFLKDCADNRNRDPQWMVKFKMGVIGSTVLTRYNNQTYRIDDVDENSNTQSTFKKKDGSSISYIDYYREKHKINLSNHQQPMLVSKKKKSFKIEGDESELVYLVPELCTLTGLTQKMRDNRFLMADLAVYTRVGPSERIGKYNSFINRILDTPKSAESLSQWNLTLSNKLVTFNGRVLTQETLQGNQIKYPAGNTADWTTSLRSAPMFTCAEIKRWAVLGPQSNGGQVRQFVKTLLTVAKKMSFNLPPPEIVDLDISNMRPYLTTLDQVINRMNPSFILCIINRNDHYHVLKRQLSIDRAVPSQVVLMRQIEKNNMSVCTKIAIQINCKLGGAPWRVVIPEKNMMIVGFDVCHDKQNKNKSYGALVATMNDSHTAYFSCVQPHESGQELSSYFAMSIAKALNKYRSKNKTLPNSIIIYRDGVGDGQLSYVHRTEVDMVKKTCKDFYGEKKVGMAFIIVKKRISTRFFCSNPKNYQNPPPGTVIDNTVTDPTMYDFYLISQNVTQGTVTPTHYNVIVDTLNETTATNITPGIMQKLTYKLTHMYYNWSGTVRVPAPCQLAHKLAFLTGQSLQNPANPGLEDLLYFL
ncbi:piwi-like protein Siwi [Metopolophium dirhodum]|uniref:piwi-like protein Siwi n=1 Tax=Metopolophium dirhodum TaxID=44670 RepID=UPI00298FF7C7|nr:piwi-like protein Siwi [Metopolophium dirhodum]XP_060874626.1 piwi-like protein Siwi [Metopolophium dirhodum]